MKAIMLKALFGLLSSLLGVVSSGIIAFIRNLQASRMDNVGLTEAIGVIIKNLEKHPDWTGAQKRDAAIADAKIWINAAGFDVKESLLRTLIELQVQTL